MHNELAQQASRAAEWVKNNKKLTLSEVSIECMPTDLSAGVRTSPAVGVSLKRPRIGSNSRYYYRYLEGIEISESECSLVIESLVSWRNINSNNYTPWVIFFYYGLTVYKISPTELHNKGNDLWDIVQDIRIKKQYEIAWLQLCCNMDEVSYADHTFKCGDIITFFFAENDKILFSPPTWVCSPEQQLTYIPLEKNQQLQIICEPEYAISSKGIRLISTQLVQNTYCKPITQSKVRVQIFEGEEKSYKKSASILLSGNSKTCKAILVPRQVKNCPILDDPIGNFLLNSFGLSEFILITKKPVTVVHTKIMQIANCSISETEHNRIKSYQTKIEIIDPSCWYVTGHESLLAWQLYTIGE